MRPTFKRTMLVFALIFSLVLQDRLFFFPPSFALSPITTEREGLEQPFLTAEQQFGNPTTINPDMLIFDATGQTLTGVKPEAYETYWRAALSHQTPVILDLSQSTITEVATDAVKDLPIHILKLPATLRTIGERAFADNLITELEFFGDPAQITIGKDAFRQVVSEQFYNTGTQDYNYAFPYSANMNMLRYNPTLQRYMPAVLYTPIYWAISTVDAPQENPFKIVVHKADGDQVRYAVIVPEENQYLGNIHRTHEMPALDVVPNLADRIHPYSTPAVYAAVYENVTLTGKQVLVKNDTMYIDMSKLTPKAIKNILEVDPSTLQARVAVEAVMQSPAPGQDNHVATSGFSPLYLPPTLNGYTLVENPIPHIIDGQGQAVVNKIHEILSFDNYMPNDNFIKPVPPSRWAAEQAQIKGNPHQNLYNLTMQMLEKKHIDFAFVTTPVDLNYRYFDTETGALISEKNNQAYSGLHYPEPVAPQGYALVFQGTEYFNPNELVLDIDGTGRQSYNIPVQKAENAYNPNKVTLSIYVTNLDGVRLGENVVLSIDKTTPLTLPESLNTFFTKERLDNLISGNTASDLMQALTPESQALLDKTYQVNTQIHLVLNGHMVGPKGDPGRDGANGAKGDPGERGLTGMNGAMGEKGERGERGERGEPGKDGAPGAPGPKGEKGDRGERGEKGPKGDPGQMIIIHQPSNITGKTTLQGTPGLRGEKGEKGDAGKDGKDGKDGITPHIGDNGNWFIGDQDTGITARHASGEYLWWPVIVLALCVVYLYLRSRRMKKEYTKRLEALEEKLNKLYPNTAE